MDRRLDPRTIVTPYAFSVHPDLLGMPLATPWQRLGAIAVDLMFIGVLLLFLRMSDIGWQILGIGTAFLLFRLATRKSPRAAVGKAFRIALGCMGIALLGVTILVVALIRYQEPLEEIAEQVIAEMEREGVVSVERTDTSEQTGAEDTPPQAAPSWIADSAAVDSVAALEDRIRGLERDVHGTEDSLAEARQRLEESDRVFGWLWKLIDDLGLGFGWAALYMTVTHAWWRGTSVGKRLFGIRVVMIDKRPLGWWLSFERAGGYAAGFATGLLGFAQVFWDPNRQGIHDKVAETIVIQDGKQPLPGPWIAEGTAQWDRARSRVPPAPPQ